MRTKTRTEDERQANGDNQGNQKSSIEDDLKWVEENVPQTLVEA